MATIDVKDAAGATQTIQEPLAPGRAADAASRPVALSNEDVAMLGALTEAAPASDTASSGHNGRLQRIAQRLTSLIALMPSALGGTTSANSLPVVLSSDGPFATQTGSITETAPASDTASSGLNGRLQRIAQRVTSLIALLPTAIGPTAKAGALSTTTATDDPLISQTGIVTEAAPASDTASSGLNGRLQRIAQRLSTIISGGLFLQQSQRATYMAVASGYAAYATPTDLFSIFGSGTKTIQIVAVGIAIQSTAAALQTIDFIKRSAANSGGTPTALTAIPLDSADAAAAAALNTYASAPSTGSSVGTLDEVMLSSATLTTAPSFISFGGFFGGGISPVNVASLQKPITLRGTGEGLCINYKGAALTAGFLAQVKIVWVEF